MQFSVVQFPGCLISCVKFVFCDVTFNVEGRVKWQITQLFSHFSSQVQISDIFLKFVDSRNRIKRISADQSSIIAGCIKATIGGSWKVCLSSGFRNSIDLWCLLKIKSILDRWGLKSIEEKFLYSFHLISFPSNWVKIFVFFEL